MYEFTCPVYGKRGYNSFTAAESELRRLRSKGDKGGKRLVRPYRCPKCVHWHLTSEKELH